jgi:hypothetical protein
MPVPLYMTIELDEQAWRAVLALLAKGPWEQANPLIMAIGAQMQAQTAQGVQPRPRGNSGEAVTGDPPSSH